MMFLFCARPAIRLATGFLLGVCIAAVDNFANGGEVSPIIIVAMLFVAAAFVCAVWGRRGWLAVLAIWACVPLAHVVKHLLGLPDTLHPDTYGSIVKLAGFSLVVTAIGAAVGGMIWRRIVSAMDHRT